MEMESGKLFIGGISWDTNEERLRDYFQNFGQVIEAVIMKDRTTGRARGFGFIVFSDPSVAERVVKDKHIIDGRTVEAKKAVPRDDQQVINRTNVSVHGSPGPTRTKKIFVGGLASTVTEIDFKNYFDQFGSSTDVVVMYDHNTQRPRGFGFITFDSEESVDRVLHKTFHELNGKMVEVKRAVPKESSSPGVNRGNVSGFNYGLSRVSSYGNGFGQGYSQSSLGGYGVRVDGRFSPVSTGRNSYSPFGPSSYNIGPETGSLFSTNYDGNGNGNFNSDIGYGRAIKPVTPNRFVGPIGPTNHDMWGNGNQNYTNSQNLSNYGFDSFGGIWANHNSGESGGGNAIGYGRNSGGSIATAASFGAAGGGDIGGGGGGGSFYVGPTWRSSSPDVEVSGLFDYGFRNLRDSDGIQKKSVGYSVANRSNRGIAA